MTEKAYNTSLPDRIFDLTETDFSQLAIEVFRFQYDNNDIYREYADLLKVKPQEVSSISEIPFLPIQLFKSRIIQTTAFEAEAVFESSGTTGSIPSRHFVKRLDMYEKSFLRCFNRFYGEPDSYCIIGLLPSYLERKNSSLVYMTETLIRLSRHHNSEFYLHDFEKLHQTLLQNEKTGVKTILIGVTYALLDFSEQFPIQLQHTLIMETGGMKGRREEISKQQLHLQLSKNFGVTNIHSEYGMTELLSQAYSNSNGIYRCPAWMKIVLRSEDDPLITHEIKKETERMTGPVNIIDLANLFSCSFIATEDYGRLYADGSFEISGRISNADTRGCSQMWI